MQSPAVHASHQKLKQSGSAKMNSGGLDVIFMIERSQAWEVCQPESTHCSNFGESLRIRSKTWFQLLTVGYVANDFLQAKEFRSSE